MKKILRNKFFWAVCGIIIVVGIYLIFRTNPNKQEKTIVSAKQETLVEEVLVTGTVKANEKVDLAFEKSGKIRTISVKTGDIVEKGEQLASLEATADFADTQSVTAKIKRAQAELDEIKIGARPEDIAIEESNLSKAQHDLTALYDNVETVLRDALIKSDNAVTRQTNGLFTDAHSANPELSFITNNQTFELATKAAFVEAREALQKFFTLSEKNLETKSSIESALREGQGFLHIISSYLQNATLLLDYAVNPNSSTITTHKDNVNTARTSVTTAETNVKNQIQSIENAKIAAEKAQRSLALKKAPATSEQIAIKESALKDAEAGLLRAEAELAKNYILAPWQGIITKQDGSVGEIISANNSFITLIGNNQFKIEADVPETDIARIKTGDPADVTLDAYGDEQIWRATVELVDPAEKVIDGVPTYRATFQFETPDVRIRSGMTANITIVTNRKENVVSIPERAVFESGGKKFVRIPQDKTVLEREVSTGIRGSNGNIEILRGLEIGEKVMIGGK